MENFNLYGCIPNFETPEALSFIENSAVPWDATDFPQVADWGSFQDFLEKQFDQRQNWWQYGKTDELFTKSQSYRPNCAGFALANASLCSIISQRINRYSEHLPVKFNPMVCWQKSKNGSVRGGQSIAEIAIAGNKFGNYLADDCGAYDPAITFETTNPTEDEHAQKHQIGYALYTGSKPWEAVLLACRKGYACVLGNSRAVGGCQKDKNGVYAAFLSGSWAHATAACGYKNVNGKDYVFWINSHGDIYKSPDETPDFGCWMSEETLRSFLGSSFNDVAVITYCEAEYDTSVKATLNPEL